MGNKLLSAGRIVSNKPVIKGGSLYDMVIHAPEAAAAALPGQIVHVDCGGDTSLRRPISICECMGDELRLCYDVRGKGTLAMAAMKEGNAISLLGPLGRGFELPESGRVLLVGGGIGIYPLVSAAAALGARATALLGFRSASLVNSEELFAAHGCAVRICTDDGSYGERGFVSALLEDELKKGGASVLMCGPYPMMKACAAVASAYGAPAQASLEERMGCGVGACLACVCKLKLRLSFEESAIANSSPVKKCFNYEVSADADSGKALSPSETAGSGITCGCAQETREPEKPAYRLARVCVDGPVFDAKEIIWE